MRVGLVGWRGMVGSVLLERMQAEGDFDSLEVEFYSTSQVGAQAPAVGVEAPPLKDAWDTAALSRLDVVVTCQGGDYTKRVYPELRKSGWQGYWIDAASTLRMDAEAAIVLDPVNRAAIDAALVQGVKTFVGGNCTVSLMLMAFGALFQRGWVEWLSSMTYQAASGAGARNMRELVQQMRELGQSAAGLLDSDSSPILELDRQVTATLRSSQLPTEMFGAPLAASLLPWIDRKMELGETREEWVRRFGCCACSRIERSSWSEVPHGSRSTSGSSRQPTRICSRECAPERSGRTSGSGSTCSRSKSRRYGSAQATFRHWFSTSSSARHETSSWGTSPSSPRARSMTCSHMTGPATCGSSRT